MKRGLGIKRSTRVVNYRSRLPVGGTAADHFVNAKLVHDQK